MLKNQYNEIKKYRKRRQGLFTIKKIVLVFAIMLVTVSIGYSYWNTSIRIKGTVTAIGDFGGGGTQTTDEYDPDNLKEGTYTYTTSPGKPTVTVENGVVKEYTFTDNTGYDTSSEGIDTGFIPFENGKNFEIKIRAYYPSSNKSNNAILLDVRNRKTSNANCLQIAYLNKKTPPKTLIKYGSDNKSAEDSLPLDANENVDITIRYIDGVLTITNNGSVVRNQSLSITINNMSILLGHSVNTSGNVIRKANATIYEFSVKEI